MDLTSRDGDWFLDELCSMSSNVLNTLEMLTVKPLLSHDLSLKIVTAMKRGTEAVLTARSERGTQTKDTFSLLGFTAAIEDAETRCTN